MKRFGQNSRGKREREDITGPMTWDTADVRRSLQELKEREHRPPRQKQPERTGIIVDLTYEEADMLMLLMRGVLLNGYDERAANVLEKLKGVK